MFIKTGEVDSGDLGIILSKYDNKFQLVQAFQSEDYDEAKMNFCFPAYGQKSGKTAVPMGVTLGRKKAAVKLLKSIIKEIEG
jgi:hypothetical protein